jgi:hypothetical protein
MYIMSRNQCESRNAHLNRTLEACKCPRRGLSYRNRLPPLHTTAYGRVERRSPRLERQGLRATVDVCRGTLLHLVGSDWYSNPDRTVLSDPFIRGMQCQCTPMADRNSSSLGQQTASCCTTCAPCTRATHVQVAMPCC